MTGGVWDDRGDEIQHRMSATTERRVLDDHLAAMAAAAATIDDLLGKWAQEWCRKSVETAVAGDEHRTQLLKTSRYYDQLMDEAAELSAALPGRIAAGFRASAWRHLYVDIQRDGTGTIMANFLDPGPGRRLATSSLLPTSPSSRRARAGDATAAEVRVPTGHDPGGGEETIRRPAGGDPHDGDLLPLGDSPAGGRDGG